MAIVNLRNVTYKYPLTNSPALQNINLQVEEGEFVALIGPNRRGQIHAVLYAGWICPPFLQG